MKALRVDRCRYTMGVRPRTPPFKATRRLVLQVPWQTPTIRQNLAHWARVPIAAHMASRLFRLVWRVPRSFSQSVKRFLWPMGTTVAPPGDLVTFMVDVVAQRLTPPNANYSVLTNIYRLRIFSLKTKFFWRIHSLEIIRGMAPRFFSPHHNS